MIPVCPKCEREMKEWPLIRKGCAPKEWAMCINPDVVPLIRPGMPS